MSLLDVMTKKAVMKMFKKMRLLTRQELDDVEPVDQINNKNQKPEVKPKKAKK